MILLKNKAVQVVDNRATQDTFQGLKEIKICNFYVPFLRLLLLLWDYKKWSWVALLSTTTLVLVDLKLIHNI